MNDEFTPVEKAAALLSDFLDEGMPDFISNLLSNASAQSTMYGSLVTYCYAEGIPDGAPGTLETLGGIRENAKAVIEEATEFLKLVLAVETALKENPSVVQCNGCDDGCQGQVTP